MPRLLEQAKLCQVRAAALCCMALVLPALACQGVGQECTVGNLGDDCGFELHCDRGVCVCDDVVPVLRVGQSCVAAGRDCEACASGLDCVHAVDACAALGGQAAGEACDIDEHCRTGLVCNAAEGVTACESPGARVDGEGCSSTANCAAGLVCGLPLDPDHCRPLGGEAALCRDDTDCAIGLTCNEGYAPFECHAPGGAGSWCGRDVDCSAPLLCDLTTAPPECAP